MTFVPGDDPRSPVFLLPKFLLPLPVFFVISVFLFVLPVLVNSTKGQAQPALCVPETSGVEPYTVARIHVDEDASASDRIHITINGYRLPDIATGASDTDDEVILAIKAGIDAELCLSGPCVGRKRFTVASVGDTTLLVTGDRVNGSNIDTFSMYCDDDGGFFLNWQLVEMPAMVVDFDPKNPMGGFDDDSTDAMGDSGQGATIVGNRDTTAFSFNFAEISGLKDHQLAVAYMSQILGDPDGYCMMGARSGFVLLREGDLPVVEGTLTLADETMGGIAVVPPVISGISPDIVDPSVGGTGTLTIRGYNMQNPDFPGVIPAVEIGGVDVGTVTAPNKFTLQFTAPTLSDGNVRDIAVIADWGTHISFDKLAYSNKLQVRCRMSTVNATAVNTLAPFSLSYDALLVNGSSGNELNEITLDIDNLLTIRVERPPSITGNAAYTLWVDVGPSSFEPALGDVTPRGMGGSQGSTCRPFNVIPPTKIFVQMAPRNLVRDLLISSRLNGSKNLFLQALIRDDASNDTGGAPTMSVTNGILLRIVD